jgi:very-short-patch-repair endonuclease
MDRTRLRYLLSLQIPGLKNSVTHEELPALCEKLGLPNPPDQASGDKRQRLETSLASAHDSTLPKVAERLLALRPLDGRTRNNIEDTIWSDQGFDIPRRIRRELARGLDIEDLYRNGRKFEAVLDRFWHLDDDELESFVIESQNSRSLRRRIERHVFQNTDWNVEELFEQLGAFDAASPRFARFVEALTSSEVHEDEPAQRLFVARSNPHLRACNVELRETGTDEGYPVFTAVLLTDKTFVAPKQLIFASPDKPDIRFLSAVDNDIEIATNADRVLVYDRPIGVDGLTWSALQDWWQHRESLATDEQAKKTLYRRLEAGLPTNSPPQRRLFRSYFQAFKNEIPHLPALLPEVWLHWDPKTVRERGIHALTRFRMDFLMLLPRGIRVVIEVDGKQHYSSAGGKADGHLYAKMVTADRDLKLAGYEVFRFGADELRSDELPQIKEFFDRLFDRFKVRSPA